MRNQLRLYSQRLLSNALVTGAHDSAVNLTTLKALYTEISTVRTEQRSVVDAIARMHLEITQACCGYRSAGSKGRQLVL